MSVCCVCCVGSGPYDELITHTEESTGFVCVIVRDLETRTMRRPKLGLDCWAQKKN